MKKTISTIADYIFWYLLYALPLLVLLLSVYRTGSIPSIYSVFDDLRLMPAISNFYFETLSDINILILPSFMSEDMLIVLSYYATVLSLHLIVDILLFAIRWGHHFLDKSTRSFHE